MGACSDHINSSLAHAFLVGSGGMTLCPPENFDNLSTLRCNLVHSGESNLANATMLKYLIKCSCGCYG